MSLSIGIVGLPNVGKSTLFNALTRQSVDSANYPFCTIDPSVGVVPVQDERIDALADISSSENKIYPIVEFVDIAGLVSGASKGEGLGNKFLSHIREVDAIAHMVRVFPSDDIVHVSGVVDPIHDIEIINTELALADLTTVSKRLQSLEKEVRAGTKGAKEERGILEKILEKLENGDSAREVIVDEVGEKLIKQLNLLTKKPMMYILNISEDTSIPDELIEYFERQDAQFVEINALSEEGVKEFDEIEKRELGVDSGLHRVISTGYSLLNLITFFTTGKEETRGWTTKRGNTAPEAGTAIHTDFRDKFIRAEVVYWEDLVHAGSYVQAREKGIVRLEGKEYIVKDGDVVHFRI